jgi:hypothetical protein
MRERVLATHLFSLHILPFRNIVFILKNRHQVLATYSLSVSGTATAANIINRCPALVTALPQRPGSGLFGGRYQDFTKRKYCQKRHTFSVM